MTDEVQKLILQVEGEEQLKKLNAQLQKEDEHLRQLLATQAATAAGQGRSNAVVEASAQKINDLNAKIKDLEKSTGQARTGGLLQLQYVLDDLTNTSGDWSRKLAAISNNIPSLALSLGAGSQLAGAIGFLSTALIGLAPLATKVWNALTGEGEGPETVYKAFDAVEERLKKIRKELEAILASTPMQEQETAKLVREFFEGQGQQITGGLAHALIQSGRAGLTGEEQAQTAPGATVSVEGAPHVLTKDESAQMRASIMNRRAAEMAGKIVGAAPTERGARDTMRAMARQFPGAFPKGFAGQLGELEPEAVRAADEAVEAEAAHGEALIAAGRRRRASNKEVTRLEDEFAQSADDIARGERMDAAKKAEDAAKKAAKDKEAARKDTMKKVNATSIDERAEMEAASMLAAGGWENSRGQFVRANPNQQLRRLQGMAAREVHQRFPHLSREEATQAGQDVAEQASARLQERLEAANSQALNSGLDALQATQAAMQRAIGELQQVTARARQLEQRAYGMQQMTPSADRGDFTMLPTIY